MYSADTLQLTYDSRKSILAQLTCQSNYVSHEPAMVAQTQFFLILLKLFFLILPDIRVTVKR